MAGKFSEDEARAILERSRELLSHDGLMDTRQVSEPEMSREEILQAALSRPVKDRNAQWAAKRTAEAEARAEAEAETLAIRETTMAQAIATLETRIEEKLAGITAEQREFVFEAIGEAFKVFYDEQIVPLICEPYEKKFAELQASIDTLRTELKQLSGGVEPITLPNPLAARRIQ